MNKLHNIIREEIQLFFEEYQRKLGKKFSDVKGSGKSKIYRAVAEDVNQFLDKDYVTMSLEFAVGHAENNEVYSDFSEKFKVISSVVDNDNLHQDSNPGEYLYSGPVTDGKTVYVSKGYDYEGYEELSKEDFISEQINRSRIEHVLKKSKVGDSITIVKDGKKQNVFFAGQKNNSFFATTYRPGESQHRQDSYMRLFPTKRINIIKVGSESVESKEDAVGRDEYYQEKEREEKRNMYRQAYAREKADPNIHEGKKSKFEKLEDNKVPLTDEERAKVMDAKATWNHGPGGKPSPAVWKSKGKDGKMTYVTHTHRAYNTAPTLKGAIGKYHSFIKGTS